MHVPSSIENIPAQQQQQGFDKKAHSPSNDRDRLSTILKLINETRQYHHNFVHIHNQNCAVDSTVSTNYWCDLFIRLFLNESTPANRKRFSVDYIGPSDDLLFFVPKKSNHVHSKPELTVLRRTSPNIPVRYDPSVNWEETVYLNLLMQHFVYVVTVAVCTQTGPQEVQILRKFSQTVYASPNGRQMDGKGGHQEVVYPNLFFSLDNYEEAFAGCVIHDSECIYVELTAYDTCGQVRGVCFLGNIPYGSLKQSFDKQSSVSGRSQFAKLLNRDRLSSTTTSSSVNLPYGSSHYAPRFIRVFGPHMIGLAEFAVFPSDHPHPYGTGSVAHDGDDTNKCTCSCGGPCYSRLPISSCCCYESRQHNCTQFTDLSDWHIVTNDEKNEFKHPLITHQPDGPSNFRASRGQQNKGFASLRSAITSISFPKLQALPSSIKSAGASADTSPVRRVYSRESNIPMQSTCRGGCLKKRLDRNSRVLDIMNRYTSDVTTTAVPSDQINIQTKQQQHACSEAQNKILACHIEPDVNIHRPIKSYDQAWSWLKQRRRVASVSLNVALTYLSLPCHDMLVDTFISTTVSKSHPFEISVIDL